LLPGQVASDVKKNNNSSVGGNASDNDYRDLDLESDIGGLLMITNGPSDLKEPKRLV